MGQFLIQLSFVSKQGVHWVIHLNAGNCVVSILNTLLTNYCSLKCLTGKVFSSTGSQGFTTIRGFLAK